MLGIATQAAARRQFCGKFAWPRLPRRRRAPAQTRLHFAPGSSGPASSDQHAHGVFDQHLEGVEQLRADGAVDHPVIAGQRAGHEGRHLDLVAGHDRALLGHAHGQDGGVRRVDDGIEALDAVHAEVGDRGGAALVLVRGEPALARALGQIAHLVGDLGERLQLGVADDRREQPAFDGHRHADVGILVAQRAALPSR